MRTPSSGEGGVGVRLVWPITFCS